jgi:cytochrome P450
MTIHPEIQARAQAEIDIVTGQKRLPEFADRANLPFVDALIKEVTRWNPVTPLGDVDTYMNFSLY